MSPFQHYVLARGHSLKRPTDVRGDEANEEGKEHQALHVNEVRHPARVPKICA